MIVLHYTGMPDAEGRAGAFMRIRAPRCRPTTSCSKTAGSSNWFRRAVAPGTQGAASWAGETDINSRSVGIEIANPGHDHDYPDFPKRQIAAVTALCRGIQTRNNIPAVRVLAHSDVAPGRKQDPGEKFPWRTLYDSGVGHWVESGADYRRRQRLARAW